MVFAILAGLTLLPALLALQAQLARESAERMGQLKAMRKNTAARTDNNLLDDVLDGQSVAAARATRAKGGADGRVKLARDNSQRAGQLSKMKRDATTDYVARGYIVPPPPALGAGEPPAGAPAEPEKKKGLSATQLKEKVKKDRMLLRGN